MDRPIAVPRPANPLAKQGPGSPVSVFDFEKKKRKSKSKSKSDFRGLYPPPRPPKRTDSSSPPLRRCLSEPPLTPPPLSPEPGHNKLVSGVDQVSGKVLSELDSENGNPRALCLDSDSADPPEAPTSCGTRAVSSPPGRHTAFAPAGTVWRDGVRNTACSEIEEVDCGAVDKKRTCAVLQSITPFAFWSPVSVGNGAVEHRKILYAAPIRAEVEEVIININFHRVSKRDLQLNRRESRRLVLLFILFNLLFGGLLIFRIPRSGERGILTPRITRTEQLLNLPDNLGTKLQLYRKLLGPKERVLALDSGQALKDMRVTALQTLWQHYPGMPWIFPISSQAHRGLEEDGATTSNTSTSSRVVQERISGDPQHTTPKT